MPWLSPMEPFLLWIHPQPSSSGTGTSEGGWPETGATGSPAGRVRLPGISSQPLLPTALTYITKNTNTQTKTTCYHSASHPHQPGPGIFSKAPQVSLTGSLGGTLMRKSMHCTYVLIKHLNYTKRGGRAATCCKRSPKKECLLCS